MLQKIWTLRTNQPQSSNQSTPQSAQQPTPRDPQMNESLRWVKDP